MNFYSEYGEDSFLFEYDRSFFIVPQFYVDVGCAHPEFGSNTAFLRNLGWKGLAIDGCPDWAPHWNGVMINAVIHTASKVHFKVVEGAQVLSRIEQSEPNVDSVTLESILQMHHVDQIGILSVDAEGAEYEVIRSMNLELHQPHFIISEYNTAGIGEDFRVMEYLNLNGYMVIHQTIANLIYARSTPDRN